VANAVDVFGCAPRQVRCCFTLRGMLVEFLPLPCTWLIALLEGGTHECPRPGRLVAPAVRSCFHVCATAESSVPCIMIRPMLDKGAGLTRRAS